MTDQVDDQRSALRSLRIEAFASESGAPRVRRSTDAIVACMGLGLVLLTAWLSVGSSALETSLAQLTESFPGWLEWVARISYVVGALYILGVLVGVGVIARKRKDVLRDALLAVGLTVGAVVVFARWLDDSWPDLALFEPGNTAQTYPAFFIALLTAVQATVAPHFSRPLRRLGWFFTLLMAVAALAANLTLLRDTVGALAVGLSIAAIVHLLFGSPGGRPSLGRIERGLADFGIDVRESRYLEGRADSMNAVEVVDANNRSLTVTVYGRDAWNTQFLTKAWRFAWYQDSGPKLGVTRIQQVEHEALALLLAERAGVSVSSVEIAGETAVGDAVLVTDQHGRLLSELAPDELSDELLLAVWEQAELLHSGLIAHGQLNVDHVVVDGSGRPSLTGFGYAQLSAPVERRRADRIELLASITLLVGTDRAVDLAQRALGDEELAATLPYLQIAGLTPHLRRDLRHEKLKVKDFRATVAERVGAEVPELERLRRVSVGSVAMTAVTGLAIYFVITALADIGWDTIVESLQGATWSLVIVALILAQLTNVGGAIALVGASPKPMPLGVATVEQFAVGFINLAIPSTAARIGLNVRFLQRFGIGITASATLGAITGVAGFVVQVMLLLLILLGGNQTMDWANISSDGGVLRILAIAVVIAVAGLAVVLVVPRTRRFVFGKIRDPLRDAKGAFRVLRSPKNTAMILGGNLLSQLLFAAALGLCVFAMGGDVTYAELIWINTIVSLFAGLMPVPGGIGVTEAGLIAGLTAVGVDDSTAVAAVIVYRMCTYYLPPIWGWFAMRWLTANDYL